MIRNHEQFELALDEATRFLSASPKEGTPDHDKLLSLMKDIAEYRPAVRLEPHKTTSETERLSRRLDDFEGRLAPSFSSHWSSMLGGDFGAAD